MKLRLQQWALALIATAGLISVGGACSGDGNNGIPGFTTGGASNGIGGSNLGGSSLGGSNTGGANTGGSSLGGSTTGAAPPTGTDELVNATGWFGGAAEDRTDDVYGMQGAFYQYGDNITCVATTGNPCTTGACCLDWTTIIDSTYASWGCGIGMELNASGGEASVKSPYAGADVVGFRVTLEGDVPGIRVSFTQFADTTNRVSPVAVQTSGPGTYDALFSETACPTWTTEEHGCVDDAVATSSHDLQVQVVGGESAGAGSLCITSITPILG